MKKNILAGITTFLLLFGVLLAGMFIGNEFGIGERIEEEIEERVENIEYDPVLDHEKAVINVIEENTKSVVSVVSSKYVTYTPFSIEDFFFQRDREGEAEERLERGEGTGFIISEDGLILTNRHVVEDEDAEYTVITTDNRKFDATVLARDPVQDLAVLKIEGDDFAPVILGNSDAIRIGQTAIAIGNALGELRDTASVGIISGVGRQVAARGGRTMEVLDDVIQTDAAINFGNSGGPLLNLKGEVIGINTAIAPFAEGINFAIPVNKARRVIDAAEKGGEVIYPFLGVRYIMIDNNVMEERELPINYGALIVSGGEAGLAIEPGSGAERAGLREGDIILEINEEKITADNPLGRVILQYNPGDTIELSILREEVIQIEATLGEM